MQIKVNGTLRNTRCLLSSQQLSERVSNLAQEINQQYSTDEPLVVLIVLHGSLLFAADLVRHFSMPTQIESIRLKSYEGTQSTGNIQMLSALPNSIKNKNVLIVEDIVDSGRTVKFLIEELVKFGVKSVKTCTLLNKPEAHLTPINPEFIGFDIGKNFVLGYGLDLDGRYRNLPYIAEVL